MEKWQPVAAGDSPPGSKENLRKSEGKRGESSPGTDNKRQPAAEGDLPPGNNENLRKS